MAEDVDPESKTEDPSPKRREDARLKGQIPFSAELVGAVILLAASIGLAAFGKDIGGTFAEIFRTDLRQLTTTEFSTLDAQVLIVRTTLKAILALAPLFGLLFAAGIAASIAQVGFQITPERLEFKLEKLNPAEGAQRLFSTAAIVKGLLAILKVLAIGGVAYWVIEGRLAPLLGLGRDRIGGAAVTAWSIVTRLAIYLSAATVLIAAIDYFYQRRRFEIGLRMTKQEVKDENKEQEGNPEYKGRMRQLARERAKKKMLQEVPKATVVITNPTHYAVALRYEAGNDAAPVLLAKGAGDFAKAMTDLARQRGVPILERPPLARAIFALVKEGAPIPNSLFQAVAEVIALIYRLR
jgi:flagellar biosynthesis protein FlhB